MFNVQHITVRHFDRQNIGVFVSTIGWHCWRINLRFLQHHTKQQRAPAQMDLLITNKNVSVLQLSSKHRVALLFIKFFGCPSCQQLVQDVAVLLPSFAKRNTIPVICHQEPHDVGKKWLEKMNKEFLHVCSIDDKVQRMFGLQSRFTFKHVRRFFAALTQGYPLELPSVNTPLIEHGIFLVEHGKITVSKISSCLDGKDIAQILNTPCTIAQTDNSIDSFFPVYLRHTSSKTMQKQIKLEDMLKDKAMKECFLTFLKNEHSEETLLFVEYVEQYKLQHRSSRRASIGKRIIQDFIKDDGAMEVNVSESLKEAVLESWQKKGSASLDLFDQVAEELKQTVLFEHFTRFQAKYNSKKLNNR